MWYKNCQIWPWHRWFQIGPVFLTLWVRGKTLGWPNMHTNVFSCDCNVQCKSKFYLTRYKGFSPFQVQLFVDFWRRHPAAWQSVWIPTSDGVKPEKLFDWIGHLHTFSPNLLWNMGTKCEWKGLGGRTYQRNESQGICFPSKCGDARNHCGTPRIYWVRGGSRSLTSKLSDWLDKVAKKSFTKKVVNIWNDPRKPCQVADHEELISLPVASLRDLSKEVEIEEVETHCFKDQQKKVNWMVMSTWLINYRLIEWPWLLAYQISTHPLRIIQQYTYLL